MAKFSAIYDACVLYPAPLRDLLMHLALTDLFKARWTDEIHAEWINALLRREQYDRKILERTRDLMDLSVRDAKVIGYEWLIDSLDLPDPNDRHVLAAAISCGAIKRQRKSLKSPPKTVDEFLSILQKQQLPKTVSALKNYIELL